MTACLVFNHHCLPFESPKRADEAVPDFLIGYIGPHLRLK